MERKKDKKVLKSKTLPPRKTYPAEFDDFDFFSSTDSSTDWEVRIASDSSTTWTINYPLHPLIYPNPHPCPIWGGGGDGCCWVLIALEVFFVTLHFKWSKYLRYSVSKFFLKPRSREKKIVSGFTNFQKPFILKSKSGRFNVPAFMHLANIYLIYSYLSV